MGDDELREAILDLLRSNRTAGAGGSPLRLTDVNVAERLDCDVERLRAVLKELIDGGEVHGKPRRVVSNDPQMELDDLRLTEDPLPAPDPRDLD